MNAMSKFMYDIHKQDKENLKKAYQMALGHGKK